MQEVVKMLKNEGITAGYDAHYDGEFRQTVFTYRLYRAGVVRYQLVLVKDNQPDQANFLYNQLAETKHQIWAELAVNRLSTDALALLKIMGKIAYIRIVGDAAHRLSTACIELCIEGIMEMPERYNRREGEVVFSPNGWLRDAADEIAQQRQVVWDTKMMIEIDQAYKLHLHYV